MREKRKLWLILVFIFVPSIIAAGYIWYISFTEDHTASSSNTNQVSIINSYEMMDIQIEMDPDAWADMLENAKDEKYVSCNITINGELFENVGIRPKGNSSLSQVASNPDSDRYSFKVKLDKYVDGLNYQGQNELILNNNISDTTYLKEFMSYEMMQVSGVPTPMHAFANISVNDESWGLYLYVESVSESFVQRNYGTSEGNLYKPEIEGMGRGSSENGMNLAYQGDDIDLYSGITSSAVFKSTNDKDYKQLVTWIKSMNTGEGLAETMNVDEVLRYFAVNTFVVNLDHYAGNMLHNYYLYERNGLFEVLPWDYNLSFGTFGTNATSAINFPIDKPTTANLEERPLINSWLSVGNYKDQYHIYLKNLAQYVQSGQFEATVEKMNQVISTYVKNDPTAFYTYEEYEKGIENLLIFAEDRAKSIVAQLDGSQPSETTGNLETKLNISALGSNNMGNKGGKDMPNGVAPGGNKENPVGNQNNPAADAEGNISELPANNNADGNAGVPPTNPTDDNAQQNAGERPQMPENMEKPPEGMGQRPDNNGDFPKEMGQMKGERLGMGGSGNSMNWIGNVAFGFGALVVIGLAIFLLKKFSRKKYS